MTFLRSLRGTSWARGLRVAFFGIAGLFVFYLLVANVILRTHLLRGWLTHEPEALFVDYRSAWSLYPGHVEVRDLAVRHQDANVQLQLGLDRASLHLSLWALTHRTLLVDRLDAKGGTFELRHKAVDPQGNEGRISAFPRIEGFADPPVVEPVDPKAERHPWTIDLPVITATMREVWTMEIHYRGDATVTGGFRVQPQREISVAPSVMITHGGTLSFGERALLRGGEGRVEATLERFDPRVVHGIDVVRQLSGSVQQTGELVSLASIADTYFPGQRLHLEHGSGLVEITSRVDRGVFQPGARVTYRSEDAVVQVGAVTFGGDLTATATVEGAAEGPVVHATATLAKGTAFPAASAPASHALELRELRSSVTFDNADIVRSRETKVTEAATSLTSAHVADLRAWQPIAPQGWTFEGGALTIAGRASYRQGKLDGRVDTQLAEAAIGNSRFAVRASGKVGSDLHSHAVGHTLDFSGMSADLEKIALRLDRGHSEGLWMRAQTRLLRVGTAGTADADIALESGPGARTVELFTRLAHVPDVAGDATSGTELHARLHLRVRPEDLSLTVNEAKNGALETRGRIRRTPGRTSGAFLVSVGPFHAGFDLTGSGVSVNPLAGGDWLDEKLRQP